MDYSRFFFESLSTNYAALPSCSAFEVQFEGKTDEYENWAAIDENYSKKGEMIGYY